jgi:hypothetical protein
MGGVEGLRGSGIQAEFFVDGFLVVAEGAGLDFGDGDGATGEV